MNTAIVILVALTSLACLTPEFKNEAKNESMVVSVQKPSEIETPIPIFQLYGEMSPADYLDGGEDTLTLVHGFLVERVAGCLIWPELVVSVKENNLLAKEQMIATYGKDWKSQFDKETGMKLVYPD